MKRWHWLYPGPCCNACKGTGYSGDPDTGGLCWDCRATGHDHAPARWQGLGSLYAIRRAAAEPLWHAHLARLHGEHQQSTARLDAALALAGA